MAVQRIVAWAPQVGAQERFCNAQEFDVLMAGGRDGGKTECAYVIALKYAPFPLYNGLILRRKLKDTKEIRDRCMRLYKKLDPLCVWDKDDNRFILGSGATIELGHCNEEVDKYSYQGREFQIIIFDEAQHFTPTMLEEIKLSCRSKDPRMKPIVRLTANPGGISHFYLKQRYMDPAPHGTVITEKMRDGREITRKYIKSTIYDNPIGIKNDPQYLSVLESISDVRLRKMMLEGDWDAAEGLFFSTFSKDVHVKKRREVFMGAENPPDDWMLFASLDWGYAFPYSIQIHAVDPGYDRLVTFREDYGVAVDPVKNIILPNVGVRKLASAVMKNWVEENSDILNRIEAFIAPPDTKKSSGVGANESGNFTVFDEIVSVLDGYGIPVILGIRDRQSGWAQCRNRLEIDPNTGEPWWYVTDNCIHTIRTLASLIEDPAKNFDIPDKAEDHAAESWRYMCQHLPLQIDQMNRQAAEAHEKRQHLDEYRSQVESFRQRQEAAEDLVYSYSH